MSAVDVDAIKAGQRLRVVYEGIAEAEGTLAVTDARGYVGAYLTAARTVSVEVLAEPEPEPWDMAPGSVVLGAGGVTYLRVDRIGDDGDLLWFASTADEGTHHLCWRIQHEVKAALDNGGRVLYDAAAPEWTDRYIIMEPQPDGSMADANGTAYVLRDAYRDKQRWTPEEKSQFDAEHAAEADGWPAWVTQPGAMAMRAKSSGKHAVAWQRTNGDGAATRTWTSTYGGYAPDTELADAAARGEAFELVRADRDAS